MPDLADQLADEYLAGDQKEPLDVFYRRKQAELHPNVGQQISHLIAGGSTALANVNPLLNQTESAPTIFVDPETGVATPIGPQPTAAPRDLSKAEPGSFADSTSRVTGAVGKLLGREQQFKEMGQSTAEGIPRLVGDIALGGAPLIADFGLQGYTHAKDAGATEGRALATGGVNAGVGAILPGATEAGGRAALGAALKTETGPIGLAAAEIAGKTAAGATTMEAGRQGQSLAEKGELAPVNAEDVGSDFLSTLPFTLMGHGLSRTPRPSSVEPLRLENALPSSKGPIIDVTPNEGEIVHNDFLKKAGLDSSNELVSGGKKNVAGVFAGEVIHIRNWTDVNGKVQPASELNGSESIPVNIKNGQRSLGTDIDNAAQHVTDMPDGRVVFQDEAGMYYTFDPKKASLVESIDKPLSDRERYDQLQQQIIDGTKAGKNIGHPDVRNAMAESETIKNKYDGMPPPVADFFHTADTSMGLGDMGESQYEWKPLPNEDATDNNGDPVMFRYGPQGHDTGTLNKFNGSVSAENGPSGQIRGWNAYAQTPKGTIRLQDGPFLLFPTAEAAQQAVEAHISKHTQVDYAKAIGDAAGELYGKWAKPITTIDDAAALVRDTNSFIGAIKAHLDSQGFGEESQKQLAKEANLAPITREGLQESYGRYLGDFLGSPNAEAASRVLQEVKNKILLSAQTAKQHLLQQYEKLGQQESPLTAKEMQGDSEFMGSLQDVPKQAQDLLSGLYDKYRSERKDPKTGESFWRLGEFRRQVSDALSQLTPEQKQTLAGIKLGPRQEEGFAYNVAPTMQPHERRTSAAQEDVSLTRSRDLEANKALLESIPVVRTRMKRERVTKGGKLVWQETEQKSKTDLYTLLSTPREERVNDNRMGGQKPVSLDASAAPAQDQIVEGATSALTAATGGGDDEAVEPASPIDKVGKTEGNETVMPLAAELAKHFDGTPQDPSAVLDGMSKEQYEAMFQTTFSDKSWNNKVAKYASVVGKTPNEVRNSGAVQDWLKDFTKVDVGNDETARKAWAVANGYPTEGNTWWKDIRENMLGKDKAKLQWYRARIMGMEPKAGVTPDSFNQATKQPIATRTKKEKFAYDVQSKFSEYFLQQGYQPELARGFTELLTKMLPFASFLDNAEFAVLADRNAALRQSKILGAHIPAMSLVNGQPVPNTIIALAMQDYVQNKSYAAFNGFLKVSLLGHELFHAFERNVVNNPNLFPLNEDTQAQVAAYHQMVKFSNELDPTDRRRVAGALIDLMVPPKYTRGKDGRYTTDVVALLNGATMNPREFMAFYQQMMITGLASKLSQSEGKQGIPQANRLVSDIRDAMMWLTKDEQGFIRGQFRYLGDMLHILQKVLDDPEYRKSQGYISTQKELRTVVPAPEDTQTKLTTYGEGQATEVMQGNKPGTKNVPVTFTKPPTSSVGATARGIGEAAKTIAEKGSKAGVYSVPNAREMPEVRAPDLPMSHYDYVRELAKVDMRVVRAEAIIENLVTNSDVDLFEHAANGEVKTIDVSDIHGTKEFAQALSGKPPSDGAVKTAAEIWNGDGSDPRYHENIIKRYLSPMQYRTADLNAQGLKIAEDARQILDGVQPTAHLLNHSIFDGITSRFGWAGDVKFDTTKDFFKFISNENGDADAAAKKAVNSIIAQQQKMKGPAVTDPAMQDIVSEAIKNLPPPKKALVMTTVQEINNAYKRILDLRYRTAVNTQRNIIANLAMVMNPKHMTAEEAKQLGAQAIGISESGDIRAQRQWVQELFQLGFKDTTAEALLRVASTGYGYLQNLQQRGMNLGAFASEQRVGPYLISYKAKGSEETATEGIVTDEEGIRRVAALQKEGATDIRKIDKSKLAEDAQVLAGRDDAQAVTLLAKQTFDKQVEYVRNIDPDLADHIAKNYDPVPSIAEQTAQSAIAKADLRRQFKAGRESVDYIETMLDQAKRQSTSMARRTAREEYGLKRLEMEQMGLTQLAKDLDYQLGEVMATNNPTIDKIKSMVIAKYLVNPSNAMIEGMQMLSSGNTQLFKEGLSAKDISNTWEKSMRRLMTWRFKDKNAFTRLAAEGDAIEKDRRSGQTPIDNEDAAVAFGLQKMNDEGRLGYEPVLDITQSDLLNANMARAQRDSEFKWLDLPDLAGNMLYLGSKAGLAAYGQFPKMNNWLASAAALHTGYQKGLRGDELQSYAIGLKDTMAVTGGRANKPMLFTALGANKIARPAVAMMSMMSTYTLGMTTMMATTAHDAILKTPGLTPQQRIASAKAFGNAFGMQMALAGALGLPLVAAAIAVIEKIFGVDVEVELRRGVKKGAMFLGADRQLGNTISDMGMNGVLSALTGADFASRTGMQSLFGINGYDGFDPWGLTGPAGSAMKDVFTAATLATQGQYGKAAEQVAPNGLKNIASMYNSYRMYGDPRIMDAGNNMLLNPTKSQMMWMALGFKPQKLQQRKQEIRLKANSDARFQLAQGRELDSMAQTIVRQEPGALQLVVRHALSQRAQNPLFDYKGEVESVINRAVDMMSTVDPLSRPTPDGNMEKDMQIGHLFNQKRQSVEARLLAVSALKAQTGLDFEPPTQNDLLRAKLSDVLIQTKGYPRQEAVQQAAAIIKD